MSAYQQELMEKVEDLQQQTRFCLNNHDYNHRNNEMQVLQEKRNMLCSSTTIFEETLQNLDDMQNTLAKVTKRCDEVDNLLEKYGVGKTNETAGDRSSGSDQEEEDNNAVFTNDKENKFVK